MPREQPRYIHIYILDMLYIYTLYKTKKNKRIHIRIYGYAHIIQHAHIYMYKYIRIHMLIHSIYIYMYTYTAKLLPQQEMYKRKALEADAAHGPRQEHEGSRRPSDLTHDVVILFVGILPLLGSRGVQTRPRSTEMKATQPFAEINIVLT